MATAVSSSTRPHVLQSFNLVRDQLSSGLPAIFLDYDGTSTPIVSDPTKAILTDSMKQTIESLSNLFPTAIVTGRKYDTITKFIHLPNLYYAGSHGFDIRAPGGQIIQQVAAEYLPALGKVRDEITAATKDIPGSLVEDNIYSISVHYRNVATESDREQIHQIVKRVYQQHSQQKLQLLPGKMVHEIRPELEWHKGKAVGVLLNTMKQSQGSATTTLIPVCLGDDTTDEDAFRTFESDPHSITVLVLPDSGGERQTNAKYICQQGEVEQFLKQLATLHRK